MLISAEELASISSNGAASSPSPKTQPTPQKRTLLEKYLPVLTWASQYSKQNLKGDVSAGITVAVMLIPQGMAYAMLAELPPIMGLYAAILPMLVYALLGTSKQLSVGPVALGVGAIAQTGTEGFILLAMLLAFMVGIIQLLMGLFRVSSETKASIKTTR